MLTVLVDTDSGNLHSAEKAFQRMSREVDGGEILVSSDPCTVRRADRVVLPGDGAFPACARALMRDRAALFEALLEAVDHRARPFLGICVGMQLMADRGLEYEETQGLGWISGDVVAIEPGDRRLKVPHMGWNDLVLDHPHPVLAGIATGDHAYFVHSFHMSLKNDEERLAHCDYGTEITAIVARDTRIGTQFHPEKSQSTGLRLIANFLSWNP